MSSSSSNRGAALGVVRLLVLTALFLAAVIGGAAVYLSGYGIAGVAVALGGAAAIGAVVSRGEGR